MSELVFNNKKQISRSVMWAFFLQIALVFPFIPRIPGIDKEYSDIIYLIIVTVLGLIFSRQYIPVGFFTKGNERISARPFFIALGLMSLFQLLIKLLSFSPAKSTGYTPLYALYIGFFVPFGEELIFRTVVLQRLKNFGYTFAIIGSTLLFAIYHNNPVQLLSAIVPGLIFGYIALKYSVKWTILLHIINNGLFVIVLPELLLKSGNTFLINYGLPLLFSLFVVIGIIASIGQKPISRIKEFLSVKSYEKGAYKVLFINIWFFLMILSFVAMLGLLVFALFNTDVSNLIPHS